MIYRGGFLVRVHLKPERDSRDDVIAKLRELHPGDPKVAVYPYAGMQHQEIELDG